MREPTIRLRRRVTAPSSAGDRYSVNPPAEGPSAGSAEGLRLVRNPEDSPNWVVDLFRHVG